MSTTPPHALKKSRLSLQAKTLALIILTLASLLLLLSAASRLILTRRFTALEQDVVEDKLEHIYDQFSNDESQLAAVSATWSVWGDTYRYGGTEEVPVYIAQNIDAEIFSRLDLNLVVLLDMSGRIVFSRGYDLEKQTERTVSPETLNRLVSLIELTNEKTDTQQASGIMLLPGGPTLIAARVVSVGNFDGPPRALLIVGRDLNDARLIGYARNRDIHISLLPVTDASLPDGVRQMALGAMTVVPTSDDRIDGYTVLPNIFGQRQTVLRASMPRTVYAQGRDTLNDFMVSAVLGGLLSSLLMIYLVERLFLGRLSLLSQSIRQIGQRSDASAHVPVEGNDELTELAKTLNQTFDALGQSQATLVESQQRLHKIVTSISDTVVTLDLTPDGEITDLWLPSPQIAEMTGYSLEALTHDMPFWRRITPAEDQIILRNYYRQLASGQDAEAEYRLITADGGTIWLRDSGHVEPLLDGKGWRVFSVLSNITARKEAENALRSSEARIRSILSAIPDLMFRLSRDGTYTDAHAGNRDLLIAPPEELIGRSLSDTMPEDVAERFIRHIHLALETGEIQIFNYKLALPDSKYDFEARLVVSGQDEVLVIVRDITERVHAEADREHLLRDMQARATELATVMEVGLRATRILDLDELLDTVANLTRDNFALYHAYIFLLGQDGKHLYLAAGSGDVGQQLVEARYRVSLDHPRSVAARAACTRAPALVYDTRTSEDYLPSPSLPDVRSELATPIIVGGDVIGVLGVQSDQVGRFTEADSSVMATLAAQLGIAIANARLFAENSRRVSIIENSTDAIALASFVKGIPRHANYVNRAGLDLLGYESIEELRSLPLADFYTRESVKQLTKEALPTAIEQGLWRGESIMRRKDGTEIAVEQSLFVIRDPDGSPRDLATIVTDITRRKASDEALRRANRAYRILSSCNQAIARSTDEANLLWQIGQWLAEEGGYPFTWSGLLDASTERLVGISATGSRLVSEAIMGCCGEALGPACLCQIAMETGQPHIEQPLQPGNDEEERAWRQTAIDEGLASVIVLPLTAEQRTPLGILLLCSDRPDAFDADETALLTQLASDLSFGMTALRTRAERERALASRREQYILTEALRDTADAINSTLDPDVVLDRLLDNLKRVVPHDAANITLIEADTARIVRAREYTEEFGEWLGQMSAALSRSGLVRQVIEREAPVIIANTHQDPDWIDYGRWVASVASAPIRREGNIIGMIGIYSVVPNFFKERHAERLQAFADQAAIAIHNASLYEAAQRHASELQAQAQRLALINRVSARLTQTLDIQELYRIVLTEMEQALNSSFGGVLIFENEEFGRLVFDTYPESEPGRDVTISLVDNQSIETVRRTHKPLASEDVLNDPLFERAWDVLRERGTKSMIIAPLLVGEDVIGTLGVDFQQYRLFTEAEIELVNTITSQASIAIAKAFLYDAERDQRILAEALRDTAGIVNSSLNFDHVLEGILANVERVAPHDSANIMLIEDGEYVRVARAHTVPTDPAAEAAAELNRFRLDETRNLKTMVETLQPIAIPDTDSYPGWVVTPPTSWIRSQAGAPIQQDGRVIGFLTLDSHVPNFYTQEHAERLQAFADQVATAIRNAQLFAAEREQRALAEALRDTAAALNSTLNFDELMERILTNVGRVVPHDSANIMLIENGVARPVRSHGYAERGLDEWLNGLRFVIADVPNLRIMVETRQPHTVPDTHMFLGWAPVEETVWIRSHSSVPIQLEGEVIGFLNLDSMSPNFFTQVHAERLQAFADQVALAFRNVQLYDAVQHHAAELEQRVAERTQELESQRIQLQTILESMGEGVIYTTGAQMLYFNPAVLALFGFSPTEMYERPHQIYHHLTRLMPGDMVASDALRTFERGESWRGEVKLTRKSGETFDAALTVSQVASPDSDSRSVVTLVRDISQEKALQEQKDRFIANASHELRTPLANIKTRLYLVRRQPEKLETHLSILERVTDSMAELIENMLDVSRFERGVIALYRRPVTLQPIIEDVVAIQQPEAERKGVTLGAEMPAEPLYIIADPQRFAQVITNLITNAINYTSEGGRIKVTVHTETPGVGGADTIVIQVHDTGVGIAPELLSQVFEPFFRANEGSSTGTGLGLTIVREIINLHEGKLSVDSTLGQGSTFTIRLALAEVPPSREGKGRSEE
ncbi:MAG TPA: GAF domain-containing protein [Aggregatilinea sp.]|uniref:GAF domain-containing protein n=1 Tax=Aggregatilinea sp. TaxID=2806333 RepID=UPI002BC810FA|nr:GAF domain-containing protein [Aggregatilinea sp.]HML23695.1 GAF domain-containing protein [Aggregatilinea sp.]